MTGCCPLNTPLVNDIVSGPTTRNRQPASLRSSDLSLLTFTANKLITRLFQQHCWQQHVSATTRDAVVTVSVISLPRRHAVTQLIHSVILARFLWETRLQFRSLNWEKWHKNDYSHWEVYISPKSLVKATLVTYSLILMKAMILFKWNRLDGRKFVYL